MSIRNITLLAALLIVVAVNHSNIQAQAVEEKLPRKADTTPVRLDQMQYMTLRRRQLELRRDRRKAGPL